MVNKVALGILAVIILTAMAVGGLVGLQLSGDEPSDGATPTPATTPTPSPTPSSGSSGSDGAGSGGGTPTATPTPTPTPTVSPADLDATRIEREVRAAINTRRTDRGMGTLADESRIDEMALNHSRAMAGQGYVAHDAAGFTTMDRYEAFGLADRCRIPDNSNTGIREGEALETVDKKIAGQNYTFASDGRTVPIDDEVTAGRAAVDTWFATSETRQKLLLEEASVAGVGVVVTERGGIYVTVDLC
jgi:uncharacterized protein YkwD